MEDELRRRVDSGIRYLNGKEDVIPEIKNWSRKIDLTNLCLSDPDACVLGQLFGNYYIGRRRLNMSMEGTALLGMTVTMTDTIHWAAPFGEPVWDVLTDIWREQIKALRGREEIAP